MTLLYSNISHRWILHNGLIFFLLARPALSGAAPPPEPEHLYEPKFTPSIGVVLIVIIAAFIFMGFISIYIRHCSDDDGHPSASLRRLAAGSVARSRRRNRGLDLSVINTFPTFNYSAVKSLKLGKGALECAVCLTEFEDDDTLRLIPKCDHVFHPDCIDAWLGSHTTCPVCRANLDSGASSPAPDQNIVESQNADVPEVEDDNTSSEMTSVEQQPLSRSMRRNVSFGRPRWFGRLSRSLSTGHVAVKQWKNVERFTLRLPEDVRKQIMTGKLERTTSLVVLPTESSSRRGYRTGFGEGSSRGRFGSLRLDRGERSDRWIFSFFSRAQSYKSTKVAAAASSARSREGSLRSSVRSESTRLPV